MSASHLFPVTDEYRSSSGQCTDLFRASSGNCDYPTKQRHSNRNCNQIVRFWSSRGTGMAANKKLYQIPCSRSREVALVHRRNADRTNNSAGNHPPTPSIRTSHPASGNRIKLLGSASAAEITSKTSISIIALQLSSLRRLPVSRPFAVVDDRLLEGSDA